MRWRRPTAPPASRSRPWAPRARKPPARKNASKAPSDGSPTWRMKFARCWKSSLPRWPNWPRSSPAKRRRDLTEVEAELDKLRRERERLGAVNLRAEEELREVETQHTNLTTERDDLVEAIRKLRLGIQSLNREARERLLAPSRW